MIRGNVKLVGEIKPEDSNKGVAAALVEAARVQAEGQKSLADARHNSDHWLRTNGYSDLWRR